MSPPRCRLAKPDAQEAEKADGKRSEREKPTLKLLRELDRTPSPVTPGLIERHAAALAELATGAVVETGPALDRVLRLADPRQLENQRQGIVGTKVTAARELLQESLRERLLLDPLTLQHKVKALYRAAEAVLRPGAASASLESGDLAAEIAALTPALPVWASRLALLGRLLPLRPALFDLVIVDEADLLALPELLGVLFRARRALLLGPIRGERRVLWPAPEGQGVPDLGRPALAAAKALAPAAASSLTEQARAHPAITDYLSRAFYDGKLAIRADYRKLRQEGEPTLGGIVWHHCEGSLQPSPKGPVNNAQALEVVRLLQNWHAAGWLTGSQTLAVIAQLPGQPALLRHRLRCSDLPESLLRRIGFFAADDSPRDAFDYVVLLPAPVSSASAALNANLGRSRAAFHDAVGAARLGLHLIGDRGAADAAGGHAGELAAAAEHWRRPPTDSGDAPPDWCPIPWPRRMQGCGGCWPARGSPGRKRCAKASASCRSGYSARSAAAMAWNWMARPAAARRRRLDCSAFACRRRPPASATRDCSSCCGGSYEGS